MKTNLRRFAPLGLVLSLLAVLGFIIILIIKGLASGSLITLPDPKVLDQGLWICVGIFALGLALTAFLDPDKTRNFLVGRQVQYGSNSIIMLVAFLGILFFINLLVYQYSSTSTPWDWTEDQQNTLAPETLNILKTLPKTITVHAYYKNPSDDTQKLLDSFKQNSAGKLTYQFINLDFDPVGAQKDGVTSDGTIVLLMDSHKESVSFASEQDLDTAIIKITNPVQHTIYFLTGHGERDIQNASETSFSQLKTILQNKNYTVKVLSLSNQHVVPDDAKAVIIAGPQVPLTADEVKAMEAYTNKGGALIVMEDPRALTKFGTAPDPLADMLTKWGITLDDDIVLDSNQNNGFLVAADTQNYGQHPITEKLIGYNLGYYTARSMKFTTTPLQDIALTILTQSLSTGVWGETNYKSIEDKLASYDPKTDLPAPLILAGAAENFTTKGRLVVFGDSDFATDFFNQQQGANFNSILLNAIDWGTQQENLISLTPKNSVVRTFQPPNMLATISTILLSICIIPLLIVLAGVWSWYSRRRSG